MSVISYGEDRPIPSNDTREGRAQKPAGRGSRARVARMTTVDTLATGEILAPRKGGSASQEFPHLRPETGLLPGREARADGIANLERRLLSGFATAVAVGVRLVMLRDVVFFEAAWRWGHVILHVVMTAASDVISRRATWRLRDLRLAKVVIFGTLTVYLAATPYVLGVRATGTAWTRQRANAWWDRHMNPASVL